MTELDYKKMLLTNKIKELGRVAVAFSSGVDSTLLLKVCHDVLGDNAIAITACSNVMPQSELDEAVSFCNEQGIRLITFDANGLNADILKTNPADRCYHCKKAIFTKIIELAKENGIDNVIEGSNLDDDNDYRPGSVAIKELGVLSPLKESELTKSEIRALSNQLGLKTADKPSLACLATRFEVGECITAEKLKRVEKSESFLFNLGFKQLRVRSHGDLARIEVMPDELERVLIDPEFIVDELKQYGFRYVTVDLAGYKMGSMNPKDI